MDGSTSKDGIYYTVRAVQCSAVADLLIRALFRMQRFLGSYPLLPPPTPPNSHRLQTVAVQQSRERPLDYRDSTPTRHEPWARSSSSPLTEVSGDPLLSRGSRRADHLAPTMTPCPSHSRDSPELLSFCPVDPGKRRFVRSPLRHFLHMDFLRMCGGRREIRVSFEGPLDRGQASGLNYVLT